MSQRPDPVRWVLRQHLGLLGASMLIMVAAPYLGSLPVRTIPAVVALAARAESSAGPGSEAGRSLATGAAARSGNESGAALASDPSAPAPSRELRLFLGDRAGDLDFVLLLLVVAGGLSFALALANTRVAARLSALANRDLRLRLHEILLTRPPDYLRQPGRADLTRTALINQSRVVASYATNTLPSAIGVLFAVAIWAQTLFVAIDSPGRRTTAILVVAGVVAVLLAVNLIALWISGQKSQKSQGEVMKEQGAFLGLAGESIQNLTSLQLNVAEAAHHRRVHGVLSRMADAEVRVASWSALATAASGGVVLLGIPLLVLAWQGLGLAGEQLAVMIPALLMLQRAVSGVGSLWTSRKVSLPSIELVTDLMTVDPRIAGGERALGRVTGRLELRGVTWQADGREILRGVDLVVEPGETVAVVGKGGSGKSSLLRLALRVDQPDHGTITLDGCDIRELCLAELRSRVAILEQHPAFFARSLRDNLVLDGREVGDDEIRVAAETARFTEVIERQSGGLDHLFSSSDTLSGSERRRLALTRLLLRNPDVIFIDELEAGLPQADAQALLRDVRAATADKTCLMVTHRPDLLTVDRVAFLHEGRILKVGSHAELERDLPEYRSLLAEKREG